MKNTSSLPSSDCSESEIVGDCLVCASDLPRVEKGYKRCPSLWKTRPAQAINGQNIAFNGHHVMFQGPVLVSSCIDYSRSLGVQVPGLSLTRIFLGEDHFVVQLYIPMFLWGTKPIREGAP